MVTMDYSSLPLLSSAGLAVDTGLHFHKVIFEGSQECCLGGEAAEHEENRASQESMARQQILLQGVEVWETLVRLPSILAAAAAVVVGGGGHLGQIEAMLPDWLPPEICQVLHCPEVQPMRRRHMR